MTNEEFTEEIYHEAFREGFIDELRREIERVRPDLSHSERVQIAYYGLKDAASKEGALAKYYCQQL
jgi:hypothetical protein